MTKALILKVTLEHRKPLTWRRLAVPVDLNYVELHKVIQSAFGWENAHLYGFYPAWQQGLSYEDLSLDPDANAKDAAETQIWPDLIKGTVKYTYDFGESWDHQIKLEQNQNLESMLPTCLAGHGAGFYEDGLGVRAGQFDRDAVNHDLITALMPDEELVSATKKQLDAVVTQDLTQQLALFENSPQRADMTEVPSGVLKVYLRIFVLIMDDLPLKQWTKPKLAQGLKTLIKQLSDDADSQRSMMIIVGDFLHVMAEHRELAPKLTPNQIDELMGQVILEQGLMPDADWDVDEDDDFNQAEEAMWDQLDAYYNTKIDRFRTSAAYQQLNRELPGDLENLLMDFFAAMYRVTHKLLNAWQSEDIQQVMTDHYAQREAMEDNEVALLPRLISEFIKDLQAHHDLAAKVASNFLKAIQQNSATLIAQSKVFDGEVSAEWDDYFDQDDDDDYDDMHDDDQEDAMWSTLIAHYSPMLGRFYASAQFRLLNIGTGSEVDDMLLDFFAAMYRETGKFVDQWQPAQVKQVLTHDYPDSVSLNRTGAEIFPKVVAAFLQTLKGNRDLTQAKADALINAVKASASTLLAQASDEDDEVLDGAAARDIVQNNYEEPLQKFFDSEQWLKINYHDQNAATNLIVGFIAQMLEQHDVLIDEWRPSDLTDMMLDYYPAHVSLTTENYAVLADLVSGFVDYLHKHKQLAAKPANRIIKTMQNNAAHMIELAADTDNWEPDKQFVEDLPNQDHSADTLDLPFSDDGFYGLSAPTVAATPRQHVETIDGRKWRQATATRVHNEAGDLMWEATGNPEDQVIAVDFADEMYAQHLLTPLKWTPEAVEAIWQPRAKALSRNDQAQQIEVLHDFIDAMNHFKSMSKKQAGRLQVVIQEQPGHSRKVVPFKPRG